MEISRPKGFLSSLRSMFNSEPPLYVDNVELRFFEACFDHFKDYDRNGQCQGSRNYYYTTSPFFQHTTRCIWCQIDLQWVKWPLPWERDYTLSYKLYQPDGTLLHHRIADNLKIPSDACDISKFTWRTFGYGWDKPGNFRTGQYQAEVSIDGVRVATGHFTIVPPPPPRPPDQLLQHPRVQFYASGRETIRFPRQTTEVFGKLTARNQPPLPEDRWYWPEERGYSVTVQCYTVEGRQLWETKSTWWVSWQEQEPSISWSCQTAGWSQGIYHVEISLDGKEFAWGAFTIE